MQTDTHIFLTESQQVLASTAPRGREVPPPTGSMMVIRMPTERLQGASYGEAFAEIKDLFNTTIAVYCIHLNRHLPDVDLPKLIRQALASALPAMPLAA